MCEPPPRDKKMAVQRPVYKIASIPADGIGPEVINAGIVVLNKLASTLGTFGLDFQSFDWSSKYYKDHGTYLPHDALDTLRKFDAILFGAVGAPGMCCAVRAQSCCFQIVRRIYKDMIVFVYTYII